ncbi:hypothetical protein [Nevskia sp.]|uniref:hypothetical protein n=1 Tax=Nevskia sp. TaxID=1929292 RepID=UPI0025D35440|nr:hypothetical protein [Nevskia sp.]
MQKTILKSAAVVALTLAAAPAFAVGYEPLTSSGSTVLLSCAGTESNPNPTRNECRVFGNLPTGRFAGTLAGRQGLWRLVRSNVGQPLIANGTRIGTLDDRVWQRNNSNEYVFGMRVSVENRLWTPPSGVCTDTTPAYFEINDMFRNGFAAITGLDIAYRQGTAEEGAWLVGRTAQGLNQYAGSPDGLSPARNNDLVDFRTDVNFEDPDGTSVFNSSYMMVAATLPNGVSDNPSTGAVRIYQGGEEGQCLFSVTASGYTPR